MSNYIFLNDYQQTNEIVYQYFSRNIEYHSTEEILAEFCSVFIEENTKINHQIYVAVKKLVTCREAEETFYLMLERCCQMLINYWCQQPATYRAIVALISLLDQSSSSKIIANRASGYRQLWLYNFTKTKSYLKLKRLARIIQPNQFVENQNTKVLGDLFYRYYFLYKYCLLGREQVPHPSQDSSDEYRRAIRNLKTQTRSNFELALIKYLSYRMRLLQIARARQFTQGAGRVIQRCSNPMWLSETELNIALKSFGYKAKKIELLQTQSVSYKDFKEYLYKYLINDLVDFPINGSNFSELLYEKILNILPNYNHRKFDEILLLNTCNQIINFLFGEGNTQGKSANLNNLINQINASYTVSLLLKIIIICPKIKPNLDAKLSLLFERYEFFPITQVAWLIGILENFLIAYSACLGKMDLSVFKVEFLEDK